MSRIEIVCTKCNAMVRGTIAEALRWDAEHTCDPATVTP